MLYSHENSMFGAASKMDFKSSVPKEDGGPNFRPAGNPLTCDDFKDEYGTFALGFPIAAAAK